MLKGVICALSACFVWGLVFIIPQFVKGFSLLEVALGGYFIYGIISTCILIKCRLQGHCKYPLSVWIKALYFSLVSTIIYYTCVVLAFRFATPVICALILGVSPITIAFYGNWKQRESSFKRLFLPSLMIILGLILINIPHFNNTSTSSAHIFGLICSLVALVAWSWYVVANSRFLKKNPQITSNDWSTLVGVATLLLVFIYSLILGIFFSDQIDMHKYFTPNSELTSFLLGCCVLGILCSWVGAFFWNKASYHLPVSLVGQLAIFETIFGLLFIYALTKNTPPQMECLGIGLFLTAVAYGVRSSYNERPEIPPELVEIPGHL